MTLRVYLQGHTYFQNNSNKHVSIYYYNNNSSSNKARQEPFSFFLLLLYGMSVHVKCNQVHNYIVYVTTSFTSFCPKNLPPFSYSSSITPQSRSTDDGSNYRYLHRPWSTQEQVQNFGRYPAGSSRPGRLTLTARQHAGCQRGEEQVVSDSDPRARNSLYRFGRFIASALQHSGRHFYCYVNYSYLFCLKYYILQLTGI